MRKRLIVGLFVAVAVITGVLLTTPCRNANLPSEGVLIFTVDTRLPDRTFGQVRIGTGRGIWEQFLRTPSLQAKLLYACSSEPWCTNTDSKTHVALGCRNIGVLYEVRQALSWRMEIPSGEQLIALSTREKFAILVSKEKLLIRKYKILKDRIIWTEVHVLQNMPLPKSIYFSPKDTAILMESGGWTYLIPAMGRSAQKVFKAHAVGWMPDGESFLLYDRVKRELLRYDRRRDSLLSLDISQHLLRHEIPIAVSPSGRYLLTVNTRFDMRRLLPEVRTFCIRGINRRWDKRAEIDAGWGVGRVCWLSE